MIIIGDRGLAVTSEGHIIAEEVANRYFAVSYFLLTPFFLFQLLVAILALTKSDHLAPGLVIVGP